VSLPSVFAIAQNQAAKNVPTESSSDQALDVIPLSFVYPKTYKRIQDVDFKNFRVRIYVDQKHISVTKQLRGGKYKVRDSSGFEEITLRSVHYIEATGENSRFAVVFLEDFYGGGSSNNDGFAEVFELTDHRLRLLQQIGWDEHIGNPKSYFSYEDNTGRLVVRSAHSLPEDAHCCPSAFDVVTLQWNGSKFVQTRVHTELTEDGIKAGKALPK
jgi:hypothetical protein